MKNNAKVRATFDALTPSKQREYVEWLAAGKSPRWKYQDC